MRSARPLLLAMSALGCGALCWFVFRSARHVSSAPPARGTEGRPAAGSTSSSMEKAVSTPVSAIDPGRAVARRLAYAQDWDGALPRESAAFREWTKRYLQASSADERTRLEGEGVGLAQARRAEMRMLIERDPARALASTVPFAVRQALPEAVCEKLEVRVGGTGANALMCLSPQPSSGEAEAIRRFVNLDHVGYVAHGYGGANRSYPKRTHRFTASRLRDIWHCTKVRCGCLSRVKTPVGK